MDLPDNVLGSSSKGARLRDTPNRAIKCQDANFQCLGTYPFNVELIADDEIAGQDKDRRLSVSLQLLAT